MITHLDLIARSSSHFFKCCIVFHLLYIYLYVYMSVFCIYIGVFHLLFFKVQCTFFKVEKSILLLF